MVRASGLQPAVDVVLGHIVLICPDLAGEHRRRLREVVVGFHGLNITFLVRTLHSGSNFDDDDVTAFQGLGGLPEGLGNLDGIVGWIHGKELLGVFWGHCGDLFGQRPKV